VTDKQDPEKEKGGAPAPSGKEPKTKVEIATKLDTIALRRAEIALERDQQDIAEWEARKAQRSLQNRQRQQQLRIDLIGRKAVSDHCNHRQGGTPKNPYKGRGDTALKGVLMPDGHTKLIMCGICRLRAWSPHPADKSSRVRHNETATAAKRRAAKYTEDKEYFDDLWEQSQNSISAEFTQPMDCGTTFTVTDEEGRQVFGPRPCDTYAHA
jgi:hypothetical protein